MLPMLLACAAPLSDLTAAPVASMPTVIEVLWTDTGADAVWVEHGDGLRAEATDGPEGLHRVLVPGYPQGATVSLRVVEQRGADTELRALSAETGYLPSGLPMLTTTVSNLDGAGFLLTTALGNYHGILVLNADGEIVWYRRIGDNLSAADVEVLRGGGGFVTLVSAADHATDLSELRVYGFDGALIDAIAAPAGHHMFEQPADGLFAFLSLDLREVEGQAEPVIGDAVRLVDRDDNARTLYTDWDYFEFDPEVESGDLYPVGLDWMHANGLHWSEDRRSLLVSYRMFNTVVEVDFDSGAPRDIYGALGERPFAPEDAAFADQHAPSWTPDGALLVFDNQAEGGESRAAEYAVGDTLALAWSHTALPGRAISTLGDARRLPDGDTLLSFGGGGGWRRVDAAGEARLEVLGGVGLVAGNAAWLEPW